QDHAQGHRGRKERADDRVLAHVPVAAHPTDEPCDRRGTAPAGDDRIHPCDDAEGDASQGRVGDAHPHKREFLEDDEKGQDRAEDADDHGGDERSLHEAKAEHFDQWDPPAITTPREAICSNSQPYTWSSSGLSSTSDGLPCTCTRLLMHRMRSA